MIRHISLFGLGPNHAPPDALSRSSSLKIFPESPIVSCVISFTFSFAFMFLTSFSVLSESFIYFSSCIEKSITIYLYDVFRIVATENEVHITNIGETAFLCRGGRLDSITSPELLVLYKKAAGKGTITSICVDMKDIECISSAGLRALLIMRQVLLPADAPQARRKSHLLR